MCSCLILVCPLFSLEIPLVPVCCPTIYAQFYIKRPPTFFRITTITDDRSAVKHLCILLNVAVNASDATAVVVIVVDDDG